MSGSGRAANFRSPPHADPSSYCFESPLEVGAHRLPGDVGIGGRGDDVSVERHEGPGLAVTLGLDRHACSGHINKLTGFGKPGRCIGPQMLGVTSLRTPRPCR